MLILTALISCHQKVKSNSITERFPLIIDNWSSDANFSNGTSYYPLYVGPAKDTIYTNYFAHILFKQDSLDAIHLPNYYSKDTTMKRVANVYLNYFSSYEYSLPCANYRNLKLNDIRFAIDISQTVHKGDKLGIPLLIKNISPDTIKISGDSDIPLKLQALDSSNQWKDIESPFRRMLCTGGINFSLPPKNVTLTSFIIPYGDFKTKIRIKFDKIHSIVATCSINYEKFY